MRSCFSQNMLQDMTTLESIWWKTRLHLPRVKNNANKMVWATSFPSLLELSLKEKNLKHVMITYKRPATIGSHITNYETLAYRNVATTETGSTAPRGQCAVGTVWKFGRH